MALRQTAPKKFGPAQSDTIYKMAYRMKFRWDDILQPTLREFLEICKVGFNCPVGLSEGAVLSMTVVFCGPKTKVQVANHVMPPNTYTICVCAPGGGKSVAFEKFICDPCDIRKEFGVNHLVEGYSSAGLHRHDSDNKNYAIVSSDEGHRLIANISPKEGRKEAERALIYKLRNGVGDKTALTEASVKLLFP